MRDILIQEIPANDPTVVPEQKAIIDQIVSANSGRAGATMIVLNELQGKIGYITEPMEQYIARHMGVPASAIHGVVTFYSFFTNRPRGKHTIKFCMGTACYVGGTQQLIDKAKQLLGIDVGDTTPDGQVTLEVCRCVGACSQAPVVVIDEEVKGRLRPNKFPQVINQITKVQA